VMGNPAFAPGWVDVYDLNEDCRQPKLQSSLPVGLLGHESGFAPDGNTFYATSISNGTVTAVDLTNPKVSRTLTAGQYPSHGLMISDDGNRAYIAGSDGLVIVDVSDIQQRRANPQFKTLSSLAWPEITIPQIATPITIGGHPYLMEIDEFSTDGVTFVSSNGPIVGAARIIDIADEQHPKVISNIRLQVHQPENRAAIAQDPGAQSPAQGYAGHYCNVPQRQDPGIVACSMIVSGLRVFDIRDPYHPKEIAYFVAPNKTSQTAGAPSNYAMSSPSFAPERKEIWYTDGNSGFYSVRLDNWPTATTGAAGGDCTGDAGFRSVKARPRGKALRLDFAKRRDLPVTIDVFQVSQGRRILKERRVAGFTKARTWRKRARDGYYFARFRMQGVDTRRIVLRRAHGRWHKVARHYRRGDCELLRSYKLERPVFGGRSNTPLRIAYRLTQPAKVVITVTRGKRTVARRTISAQAARTYRIAIKAKRRGTYKVRLTTGTVGSTLTARRL
jgi:YVTN family beta-propeller protein